MALFHSQIATEIRGSVGGLTFTRTSSGLTIRARATPTDPRPPRGLTTRGSFARLANLWPNLLTPTQRDDWNTYAANVTLTNSLGDAINVSGANMFLRTNQAAQQTAGGLYVDAPTTFNLGSYTAPTWFPQAPLNVGYVIEPLDAWANEDAAYLLVYQGIPQGPSVNFYASPWVFIEALPGSSTVPPLDTQLAVALRPFTAGQHLWFRSRVLRADGRLSNPTDSGPHVAIP